jgi:D-3-phosphoglycerate dehydrogenase
MWRSMRPAVLVTKRIFAEAVEYLRQHAEVAYHDCDEPYTPDELRRHLEDKEAAVSQVNDRFTAEVMDSLPKLRVISNVAVGIDNIDVEAATQRNIAVTNTPDVLTETTADFAFALLMATARRVVEADQYLHSGEWRQWRIDMFCGQDIHGQTLGILGMGRIGQSVARRARGFGMRLLYHDVQRSSKEIEKELGLEYLSLEEVLRGSDFITVHVPLLPETRGLLGAAQFSLMKRTAILVNTSRGPVVNESALADALAAGVIAGAGLDVFEREPEVEPRLLALRNATLTPHIASASVDTRRKMSLMAAENAVAALAGKRPPNLVNRALFHGG